MSFTSKLEAFPVSLPLPLPLPLPLGQIELDDTVRPEIAGRAAAADTPTSEVPTPAGMSGLGTPLEVPYLPTRKFVSTPYPEKKGWLDDDEEAEADGEEEDSQKGAKYVASDEDSEGEEEDDYFESEKQQVEQAMSRTSLNA